MNARRRISDDTLEDRLVMRSQAGDRVRVEEVAVVLDLAG
jgi:hypothetical protein